MKRESMYFALRINLESFLIIFEPFVISSHTILSRLIRGRLKMTPRKFRQSITAYPIVTFFLTKALVLSSQNPLPP